MPILQLPQRPRSHFRNRRFRCRGPAAALALPASIRYNRTVLSLTHRVSRKVVARFVAVFALAFGLAAANGGCSRKIGDSCTTSADCDPTTATRSCDLSQPGGYCIIEGCDARSCPEDSFCVRFYPTIYATQSCLASCTTEPCPAAGGCRPDEECVGSDPDARCVRRSLEKRICVQSCGEDGDCRGGYLCRPTGQNGTVALTSTPGATPKFCRPAP